MEPIGSAAATSGKGHPALEKTIFILVNTHIGTSAAGIFKFNIKINTTTNDSNTGNEEKPVSLYVPVEEHSENDLLKPVKLFFQQHLYKKTILQVACCRFREELYLIPYNGTRTSVSPLRYNFITNITTQFSPPLQTKSQPLAVAIGESVYALATGPNYDYLEPRFEEYFLPVSQWNYLPKFPFTGRGCHVSGYAVLKDKFILVCICSAKAADTESVLYTYNTISGGWKLVKKQPNVNHSYESSTEDMCFEPLLFGEGVVLFDSGFNPYGVIYSYNCWSKKLSRVCFTDEPFNSEFHLSLGQACVVKDLEDELLPMEEEDDDDEEQDYPTNHTGVVAKVDHDILCVLHGNPYFEALPEMKVSVIIIKVDEKNAASCTILKTFHYGLSLGEPLLGAGVNSCFVLQLGDQKDNHPGKRLKDSLASENDNGPWKRLKDDRTSQKEMDFSCISEDASDMELCPPRHCRPTPNSFSSPNPIVPPMPFMEWSSSIHESPC